MSQMWFSSFTPDENSQLRCDASHRNKQNRELQHARGQRAAYLVSTGALERHAGCGCSDRSQGYLEQMQQLLTWSLSGVWQQQSQQSQLPSALLFSLQLQLHPFPLLFSRLWKKQSRASPSSWGLKNSTFSMLLRSVEEVTPRHWWCSAAGGVLSEM